MLFSETPEIENGIFIQFVYISETPVDEFAEWRGKGVECATYFHGKPEYLYLFETLEIFCICYNRNCPETTYPGNTS